MMIWSLSVAPDLPTKSSAPTQSAAIKDGFYSETRSSVFLNANKTMTVTTIEEALMMLQTRCPQTYATVLASHFLDGNDQNAIFDGDPFSNETTSRHSNLGKLLDRNENDSTTGGTRMQSRNDHKMEHCRKHDNISRGTLDVFLNADKNMMITTTSNPNKQSPRLTQNHA
jgi:hypothetical protein